MRVLTSTRTGYAATEDCARPALLAAASAATAQGQGEGLGPAVLPTALASNPAPPLLPEDAPHRVGEAEKQVLLEAVADAAFAFDEAVYQVEARYQDAVRQVLILTSEGAVVRKAATLMGLRVAVTLDARTGPVTAAALSGGTAGFGYFFLHQPEDLAREAVNRALVQAQARPLPDGVYPVVLAAGWGGAWLHEAIGHRLEADALAGAHAVHPGTRVARPDLHLSDDPHWPEGRATMAWDDEARATEAIRLVEAGVVTALLTDRAHAARFALPGTGHARRQDYRHAPLPRMTNLILEPGTATPADLMAEVSDGLYVTMLGSGRVESAQDRFVLEVVEGWRIERGRLTTPVRGASSKGLYRRPCKPWSGWATTSAWRRHAGSATSTGSMCRSRWGCPPSCWPRCGRGLVKKGKRQRPQFIRGSSGKLESRANSPPFCRSTVRQSVSGWSSKTRALCPDATIQSPRRTSSSS